MGLASEEMRHGKEFASGSERVAILYEDGDRILPTYEIRRTNTSGALHDGLEQFSLT